MDELKVTQHNNLTFARYEMSVVEKNIFYIILSKLGKNDNSDMIYTISLKEIEHMTGSKQQHRQFEESCDKFASRYIRIRDISDPRKWIRINMCQMARYDVGTVSFRLTEYIRPYLFHLKNNFTEFTLRNALELHKKYAKRLYEIFTSEKWKEDPFEISVSELRKCLEIETKFKQWGQLKDKVIIPSIDEINKKTDLSVEWEPIKVGRSYQSVKFYIAIKEITNTIEAESGEDKHELLSEWQLERINSTLNDAQLRAIRYYGRLAEEDYNKQQEIKNRGLFWIEFINGFVENNYDISLGLIKEDKKYFNFNWNLYNPKKTI